MQIKIAVSSFFIGWSGLSILAQSASLLSGTGVKMSIFMFGKFLHGLLSAALSIPIGRLLYPEALEASVPPPPITFPVWKDVLHDSIHLLFLALLIIFIFIIIVRIIIWARKKAVD